MVRKIILIVIVLLIAAAAAFWWFTRPLPILTVMTWPGTYGRAQASALMRPYAAAKAIDVRIAQYDGGLDDLTRAVKTRQYRGDVIDMELRDATQACMQGLLERIDPKALPAGADGKDALHDFVPSALGPCWVGSVVYSQLIIFAPGKFTGEQPKTVQDFFDTRRFPGMRALNRASAKYNLELALLADGIAPEDVYLALSSAPGLDHALHKLDSLKPNLVWWSASGEAAKLVKSGGAAFATILNGEGGLFDARADAPGVIWDHQLYEFDVFGIPAGDPKKDTAQDFIRFATGSASLAGVADWVPYGPARRSSLPLVGKNPDTGIAMTPWLPTAHFDTAFAIDEGWWQVHGAAVEARWQAWLNAAH